MIKKRTLSLATFILFLFLVNNTFSQSVKFSAHEFIKKSNDSKQNSNLLRTSPVFYLDASRLESNIVPARQIEITDFPISISQDGTLELKKIHSVVDQNTVFATQTEQGQIFVTGPAVETFTGTIKGKPDSKVYLIYVDGSLFGNIQFDDNNYFISPNMGKNKDNAHTLVNQSEFSASFPFNFKCPVDDGQALKHLGSKVYTPPKTLSNKLLQVELAVETDTPFFLATGGTLEKVQKYTVALYSLVSALYEEQVNIQIHISWMKNWTDAQPDPYNVAGNPYDLAPKAAKYWGTNYPAVHRDLAQVVTADPVGQGGWALFNSLCNFDAQTELGMSFISINGTHNLPTYAFTYDVYTAAHELGHNFNAEHTHSCFWNPPIDTCMVADGIAAGCFKPDQKELPNPGSIMSYCPGINYKTYGKYECRLIFLDRVAHVIRKSAEDASCLNEPPNPYIKLFSPHGEETYFVNDDILIKWTSTQVNFVKIEYTKDDGKTWVEINKQVSATQGQYQWQAPEICGNIKIRISDASNAKLADTCLKSFKITRNSSDGLITYYPFNNNTEDAVCNFYDAVPVGTGTAPAKDMNSRNNSAWHFDGNSYLKADNFKVDFEDMTISCFFNLEEQSQGFSNLVCQNWEQGGAFQFYVWQNYLGAAFWLSNSGVPVQIWGSTVQLNNWNHVVMTVSKNTAKLYLNGKFDKSLTISAPIKPNISSLFVGSRNGIENFKGRIDEVRIYKKVLTDTEISKLYSDLQKPESTTLVSPANGSNEQDTALTLTWNGSNLADAYNLLVTTSTKAGVEDTVVFRQSFKGTTFDLSGLNYLQKYFWRVSAVNKNGESAWSSVYNFTTKTLVSVDDQFSVNELNSAIYPNPAGDAAEIKFDIDADSDLQFQIFNTMGEAMNIDYRILPGRIVFSTSPLSQGSYYYKLQSGGKVDIKKFAIVR